MSVRIFKKEMPHFIKIKKGESNQDHDKLVIHNFDQLPPNFIILIKSSVPKTTRRAIHELD